MIDKIIEELIKHKESFLSDKYEREYYMKQGVNDAIEIVKKYENDRWIDSDFAIPSFDNQKISFMIADLVEDYEDIGYYNHDKNEWIDSYGNITDNVYKWRPYKGE